MERIFYSVLFVLLQFSIFMIAQYIGVSRPIVNLDMALGALLAVSGFPVIAILLFAWSMLIEIFSVTVQVFPLVRLSDASYLLGFLYEASLFYQFLLFAVLVGLIFYVMSYFKLTTAMGKETVLALSLIMIGVSLVSYDPERDIGQKHYRYAQGQLVASQSLNAWMSRQATFLDQFEGGGEVFVKSNSRAVDRLFYAKTPLPDRFMLIVAESWGLPNDPAIHQYFKDIFSARLVGQGNIPYVGVTVGGEVRELCGYALKHLNLREVTEGFEKCFPNTLKKKGYQTVSIHGATSRMYDRFAWYPRAGFDSSIFFEDVISESRCYSFPGSCDKNFFPKIKNIFSEKDKKSFVYWLTLNSHARYDQRDIYTDRFDCIKFKVPDGEVCRNLKLQAQFFYGLADLLKAPEMNDVSVFIVGDHEPIIMDQQLKLEHFKTGTVPWFYLPAESKNHVVAVPQSPESKGLDSIDLLY